MIEAKEIGLLFSQESDVCYTSNITELLSGKKLFHKDPNIKPIMLKTKLCNQYLKFYIDDRNTGDDIGYVLVNVDTHKIDGIVITDKTYDPEVISSVNEYMGYTVVGKNIFD